jgi:glycosyltransferase involved in cell wall biosynthesis
MHIVLVTTSYPDAEAGSEAAGGFVADFARELSDHARVTVVAATGADSSVRKEGALSVHRFKVPRWPLSLLRPYWPGDWLPVIETLKRGSRALDDVFVTDRPDYVFALWALPSGHWARRMARKHGVPYGTWALGSDIWSLGRVPVLRGYLGRVLADATHRFADGLQLQRDVEALCSRTCEFLPSSRKLVGSGQDPVAANAPYRLAFLGRWHPNKGIDILLRALDRLSDEDWSRISEFRINGGGPLHDETHAGVGRLRDAGRPVSLGGYLDKDEAVALLEWADYVVLPSRIESIPVIFSDAAQLRRPLIATPVGDLPELLGTHDCGVLAKSADSDALTEAIRQATRTSAASYVTGIDNVVQQFDVAATARRVTGLVEEVSR